MDLTLFACNLTPLNSRDEVLETMRDVKVVEAPDPNCIPNGILEHLHKRAVTFPTSVAISLTSMDTRWSDIHSDAREGLIFCYSKLTTQYKANREQNR
jgi:hypothetical protein